MSKTKLIFTMDEIEELQDSYCGICLSCGNIEDSGVEPDARKYICSECGEHQVYGIEEAVLEGLINISDE